MRSYLKWPIHRQLVLDEGSLSKILSEILSSHDFIELRELGAGLTIVVYNKLPSLYVPGEGIFPHLPSRLGRNEIGIEGRPYWEENYGAFMEGKGKQMGLEAQENLHRMLGDIYNASLKHLRIPEEDAARMVGWTKWVVDTYFALFRRVLGFGDVFPFLRKNPPVAAFLVPTRVGRGEDESPSEIQPFFPLAGLIDNNLLCKVLSQGPPLVVEIKRLGEDWWPVVTVWVPITQHLIRSNDGSINPEGMRRAREIINAVVQFLLEQNIPIIGLGAVLPSLTDYGRTVTKKVPEAIVTTGHAGTCVVIGNIVDRLISKLALPKEDIRIAVIGVGSIGRAVAEYLLAHYPATVTLYDIRDDVLGKVYNDLSARYKSRVQIGHFQDVGSEEIRGGSIPIAISTATSPISPDKIRWMVDKLGVRVFIDDSQPPSVDPSSLEGTNARVVWVVGSGPPGYQRHPVFTFITPHGPVCWNYGDQGVANISDDFGCALEVLGVALNYRQLLEECGDVKRALEAVRRGVISGRPVSPEDVKGMQKLFNQYGISPSDSISLQAFGHQVII